MQKPSRRAAAALLAVSLCGIASADEPAPDDFELNDSYALGIVAHDLDPDTEVIGWRLSRSWYLGQRDQKGADDGFSLVWQGERQQVSVSLEEIRFVRRF